MGGVISSIDPGSIADQLGWRVGDEIVSINGHVLRDVVDYRFYSSDEHVRVVIRRDPHRPPLRKGGRQAHFPPYGGGADQTLAYSPPCEGGVGGGRSETLEYEIEKDLDLGFGVEFKDVLFDGVRTCGARCIFCFVEQLPKGLRKSLYLKDDDFRLSFLDGNFITLANLTRNGLDRIIEQRLSPLYVSVHTTDPDLRQRMLGRSCPDVLRQIDTLAAGRITLHTQIVLCRGINDGEQLERAVSDLAERHPTVASIAVVPVGLTSHRRSKTPIEPINAQYSARILYIVRQWQRRFLLEKCTRLVWAADEFYLSAGRRVPKAAAYEGFPQLSNGVGLVRRFKDSAHRTRHRLVRALPTSHFPTPDCSLVTGVLAAPLVREWARSLVGDGITITVCPITNRLFGETVTVAGLIAGQDVIDQLRGKDLGDAVIIPSVALRDGTFLDDVTVSDLERELNCRIIVLDPFPSRRVRTQVEGGTCAPPPHWSVS